jgi:hypothetical protein
MAQFLADIAGMLELFAIAAGLVLLHRASKDRPARLLKAAGAVLVAGGIIVGSCTTYYWFKYQSRGEFDSTRMGYPGMRGPGAGMGPGMMGPGMGPGMNPGMKSMPHEMTPPTQPPGEAR